MKKNPDSQIHETKFQAYGGYISGRRVSIKRRYHFRFIFTGVQNRFVQFRLPLNCVIIVIDEDPVHNTWVCSVGIGQQDVIGCDEGLVQTHGLPEVAEFPGLLIVGIGSGEMGKFCQTSMERMNKKGFISDNSLSQYFADTSNLLALSVK